LWRLHRGRAERQEGKNGQIGRRSSHKSFASTGESREFVKNALGASSCFDQGVKRSIHERQTSIALQSTRPSGTMQKDARLIATTHGFMRRDLAGASCYGALTALTRMSSAIPDARRLSSDSTRIPLQPA
jgi:hypothetical protein